MGFSACDSLVTLLFDFYIVAFASSVCEDWLVSHSLSLHRRVCVRAHVCACLCLCMLVFVYGYVYMCMPHKLCGMNMQAIRPH